MVERLTEHKTTKGITRVVVRNCVCEFQTVLNKLCAFEDVMEKYHCNDIEELDKKIDDFTNFMKGNKFETIEDLQNALNGKFIEVFDEKNKIWQDMVKKLTKTEKDRDTWQKACELACEWFKQTGFIGDQTKVDYFYQQAKKGKE